MKYIQHGEHPSVLLLSGMHGNEFEVIDCVSHYIEENLLSLPDFLYIPQVSPSAVSQKTRLNIFNHDINRSFLPGCIDAEVQDCKEILQNFSFSYCLDFHEDPDMNNIFYMYDTNAASDKTLTVYYDHMKSSDVQLYSGVDDSSDPTLGYIVKNGYVPMTDDISKEDTGFASGWMLRQAVAKRVFTLEVPGKSTTAFKQHLVDALFALFLSSDFMIQ